MEMIFSLHKGSQSLLWAKAQSLKVAWVFPSLSNSSPAQWRNESPRLLKGPTCQRSPGISHSQPTYCSPDHNRLHRAQPFVIKSVVNFCWGNKSVTHLQLWIKTFLPFFFFSLVFFSFFCDTLPMAVLATSKVILQTQTFMVDTLSNGGQDLQWITFLLSFHLGDERMCIDNFEKKLLLSWWNFWNNIIERFYHFNQTNYINQMVLQF